MRRLLAVLTALALAAFGAFVLITYVRDADARAEARAEEGALLVSVLVVDDEIAAGTPVEQIADHVSTERVPARLRAEDALTSVDDLTTVEGQTTGTLLAGDQVRRERFAVPAPVVTDEVVVPADLQEVSLSLDPQRAVGGTLVRGDRVGVFVSSAGVNPATNTPTAVTTLAVHGVLVSAVDRGSDTAGTALVTVTLALTADEAAAVVAGQEQDAVWLSLQEPFHPADTSSTSTSTATTGADQ